jgi:hypothetical protein
VVLQPAESSKSSWTNARQETGFLQEAGFLHVLRKRMGMEFPRAARRRRGAFLQIERGSWKSSGFF